jgi:hypothetical protein
VPLSGQAGSPQSRGARGVGGVHAPSTRAAPLPGLGARAEARHQVQVA